MSGDKLPVQVTPGLVNCQMCRRSAERGADFTVGKDTQKRSLCVYCLVAIAVDCQIAMANIQRRNRIRLIRP